MHKDLEHIDLKSFLFTVLVTQELRPSRATQWVQDTADLEGKIPVFNCNRLNPESPICTAS